ncbi:Ig-like domain-containing protein, partial [Algibacter pacificus]|uniref:Ig-like domain-containing protein n=1 Tax=Algibacter pacificus TaxID=2599389 RepID=UPI0011C93CB8
MGKIYNNKNVTKQANKIISVALIVFAFLFTIQKTFSQEVIVVANQTSVTPTFVNNSGTNVAGNVINYEVTVRNISAVPINNPVMTLNGTTTLTLSTGDNGNGVLDAFETWTYNTPYTITGTDVSNENFNNTFQFNGTELSTGVTFTDTESIHEDDYATANIKSYDCTPDAPVASAQSFCSGDNPTAANLLPALSDAAIKWYSDAGLTTEITDGTAALATGSYYVTTTVDGCESLATEVAVTVKTTPDEPTASAQSFCSGDNPTVASLMPALSNAAIKWYSDAGLTTEITDGTTALSSGKYYVTTTEDGCESLATEVDITVNPNASASDITAADTTICTDETADLSASSTVAGATFKWYSDSALTTEVGSGANFTTPALTATTTYYVTVTGTATCENAAGTGKEVIVTVNPKNSASDITAADTTICTDETADLSASSTVAGATFKWYSDSALTTEVGSGANFTTPALTATTTYYVTVTGTATCENAAGT